MSHAVECLNIFEKYPEWDRGPKRLKLPAIEDGNGNILAKVDHINPCSWTGDVRVANVSLATSWNLGRKLAESEDLSHGIADLFSGLDQSGYDIYAPFGCDIEEDTDGEQEEAGTCHPDDDEDVTPQVGPRLQPSLHHKWPSLVLEKVHYSTWRIMPLLRKIEMERGSLTLSLTSTGKRFRNLVH